MKFSFIFIFLFSINLFSQEIEYKLYLKVCDSSITESWFYYLEKDGLTFNIESLDNPKILVPKPGIYSLTCQGIDETYDVFIDNDNYRDTLNFNSVYKVVKPNRIASDGQCLDCQIIYERCREPLNGMQIDKYNNGKIKLKGTFKNGIPNGEIIEYYQSGIIKSKLTFNEDGKLEHEVYYDKDGYVVDQ